MNIGGTRGGGASGGGAGSGSIGAGGGGRHRGGLGVRDRSSLFIVGCGEARGLWINLTEGGN